MEPGLCLTSPRPLTTCETATMHLHPCSHNCIVPKCAAKRPEQIGENGHAGFVAVNLIILMMLMILS